MAVEVEFCTLHNRSPFVHGLAIVATSLSQREYSVGCHGYFFSL